MSQNPGTFRLDTQVSASSDQRFEAVFEHAGIPMVLASKEGKFLRINSAFSRLLGYSEVELRNRSFRDITHPDDIPSNTELIERLVQGNVSSFTMEKRYIGRNGNVIWVRAGATLVRDDCGQPVEIVGTFEDISEQKQAGAERTELQIELELERTRLRAIVDNMPVGIVLAQAPSGRIILGNRKVEEIFRYPLRYSPSISEYTDWVAFAADGKRLQPHEYPLAKVLATGKANDAELQFRRGDGTLAWVRVNANPVLDKNGRVIAGVVAITDIDEERRAQQEADRQARRVREVLESTTDAVFMLNRDWRFTYLNEHALRLIAGGRDLLSQRIWDAFPEAVGTSFWDSYQRAMSQRVATTFEEFYPPLEMWFEVHAYPTEEGIAVFFHDVTERRKTAEALLKSEKLAAAGRLAASISHEINNPLASVTNLLYLLRTSPDLPQLTKPLVELAEQELARVSHITTQTLRFYRQSTKPDCVDINATIDNVLALYEGRFRNAEITIERRFRARVPVYGYSGEIRQVLTNLITNAADAMNGRAGRLLVRTRMRNGSMASRGVVITIADTGSGMSEETRKKLFEPFFSTKGINGTGLGLWVSKEIVDKHSGSLRIVSREGRGSVFQLFLPHQAEFCG